MSDHGTLCQIEAIRLYVEQGYHEPSVADLVELRDASRGLCTALERAIVRAWRLQQDRGAA
jgi:hypothetical protein